MLKLKIKQALAIPSIKIKFHKKYSKKSEINLFHNLLFKKKGLFLVNIKKF